MLTFCYFWGNLVSQCPGSAEGTHLKNGFRDWCWNSANPYQAKPNITITCQTDQNIPNHTTLSGGRQDNMFIMESISTETILKTITKYTLRSTCLPIHIKTLPNFIIPNHTKVCRVGLETCLSAHPYHEARLNACCGFSGVHGAPGGQDARLAKIKKEDTYL